MASRSDNAVAPLYKFIRRIPDERIPNAAALACRRLLCYRLRVPAAPRGVNHRPRARHAARESP